ncbi:unnamed protein product, partial [Polarella glacialis]
SLLNQQGSRLRSCIADPLRPTSSHLHIQVSEPSAASGAEPILKKAEASGAEPLLKAAEPSAAPGAEPLFKKAEASGAEPLFKKAEASVAEYLNEASVVKILNRPLLALVAKDGAIVMITPLLAVDLPAIRTIATGETIATDTTIAIATDASLIVTEVTQTVIIVTFRTIVVIEAVAVVIEAASIIAIIVASMIARDPDQEIKLGDIDLYPDKSKDEQIDHLATSLMTTSDLCEEDCLAVAKVISRCHLRRLSELAYITDDELNNHVLRTGDVLYVRTTVRSIVARVKRECDGKLVDKDHNMNSFVDRESVLALKDSIKSYASNDEAPTFDLASALRTLKEFDLDALISAPCIQIVQELQLLGMKPVEAKLDPSPKVIAAAKVTDPPAPKSAKAVAAAAAKAAAVKPSRKQICFGHDPSRDNVCSFGSKCIREHLDTKVAESLVRGLGRTFDRLKFRSNALGRFRHPRQLSLNQRHLARDRLIRHRLSCSIMRNPVEEVVLIYTDAEGPCAFHMISPFAQSLTIGPLSSLNFPRAPSVDSFGVRNTFGNHFGLRSSQVSKSVFLSLCQHRDFFEIRILIGSMAKADVVAFHAGQCGLPGGIFPAIIRGGFGINSCWASMLRAMHSQSTSQSTPWRRTTSLGDVGLAFSGKDLLMNLEAFEDLAPILVTLGCLDLSPVLMARFVGFETIHGSGGNRVCLVEALNSPPANYLVGSMDMYLEVAADALEAEPNRGLNEMFDASGKIIFNLRRIFQSVISQNAMFAGRQEIGWIDFLWLFTISGLLISGVSPKGDTAIGNESRKCSWCTSKTEGESWVACYWMSIGPAALSHLIDTSLMSSLDGGVAKVVRKISEAIAEPGPLQDRRIAAHLRGDREEPVRALVPRLLCDASTPPIDVSLMILKLFVEHARSLQAAMPDGWRAMRINVIGSPTSSDALRARLRDFAIGDLSRWGSPKIVKDLRDGIDHAHRHRHAGSVSITFAKLSPAGGHRSSVEQHPPHFKIGQHRRDRLTQSRHHLLQALYLSARSAIISPFEPQSSSIATHKHFKFDSIANLGRRSVDITLFTSSINVVDLDRSLRLESQNRTERPPRSGFLSPRVLGDRSPRGGRSQGPAGPATGSTLFCLVSSIVSADPFRGLHLSDQGLRSVSVGITRINSSS